MEVVILLIVAFIIGLQLFSIYLIFRDSKRNDDMLNEILKSIPKVEDSELSTQKVNPNTMDDWGDSSSEW